MTWFQLKLRCHHLNFDQNFINLIDIKIIRQHDIIFFKKTIKVY